VRECGIAHIDWDRMKERRLNFNPKPKLNNLLKKATFLRFLQQVENNLGGLNHYTD
jgi:hypothetical protein